MRSTSLGLHFLLNYHGIHAMLGGTPEVCSSAVEIKSPNIYGLTNVIVTTQEIVELSILTVSLFTTKPLKGFITKRLINSENRTSCCVSVLS